MNIPSSSACDPVDVYISVITHIHTNIYLYKYKYIYSIYNILQEYTPHIFVNILF